MPIHNDLKNSTVKLVSNNSFQFARIRKCIIFGNIILVFDMFIQCDQVKLALNKNEKYQKYRKSFKLSYIHLIKLITFIFDITY